MLKSGDLDKLKKFKKFTKCFFIVCLTIILMSFIDSGRSILIFIFQNLSRTYDNTLGNFIPSPFNLILDIKYWIYLSLFIYCCIVYPIFQGICNHINNKKEYSNPKENEGQDFNTLRKYLYSNDSKISLLFVDGPWGIGKTYYVKNSLKKLNKKYYYVSLFGLHSRDQIIKELANEVKNSSMIKYIVQIPVIGKIISIIYLTEGLRVLKKEEEKTIVFDDLERTSISYNEYNNKLRVRAENINDAISLIDYISQNYKNYKLIVILDSTKMSGIFNNLIIPKINPHIISMPYDKDKIKSITMKHLPEFKDDKIIIDFFVFIWEQRVKLKEELKFTYRPLMKDLELLSSKKNTKKDIFEFSISRLVEDLDIYIQNGNKTREVGVKLWNFLLETKISNHPQKQIIDKVKTYIFHNKELNDIFDNAEYRVE